MTECAMEGASFRDTLFQVVADVAEQGSCLAMPVSGIDQRSKAGDGGRTEKQNFGTIGHAACSWAVWACLEHMLHGGRRDAVAFGDLSKALATLTVLLDSRTVQYQRLTADVLTFEPGAPHAGAHPFDDQTAFKLSDGADDHDDSPAQRAAGVDVFPEADVLDADPIQLVEHIEE